jgi:hypothetical protein
MSPACCAQQRFISRAHFSTFAFYQARQRSKNGDNSTTRTMSIPDHEQEEEDEQR